MDTNGYDITIGQGLLHSNIDGDDAIDGGLTKQGAGVLTLSGANTYTGETTISEGILRISTANGLGTTDGETSVASGAQLELTGGITVSDKSLTVSGNGSNNMGALQSQSGANIWAGNVTLGADATRIGANGSGQSLTISGVIDDGPSTHTLAVRNADGGGTVVLSGANTYGGSTDVVVGLLQVAGGNDRLPTGTVLRIGNTANVEFATFDLNGQNQQVAGLTDSGTTMTRTVTNSSAALSTLTVNNASDYTYAGIITGNLALTKSDSARLTLSGDNSYTGATSVTQGVLRVAGDNSLGATSAITVTNGARVELYGGATVTGKSITIHGQGGNSDGALQSASGDNTWAGDVVIGSAGTRIGSYSGTLTVSGVIRGNYGLIVRNNDSGRVTVLAGENTYTGATQVVGGTTKIDGGHNRLPIGTTLQLGLSWASAEFDLNGWNQEVAGLQITQTTDVFNNIITNSSATPSILTVNQSSSNSFGGTIGGNLSLTKAGSGTLTLTGNSTYTGTTLVSGGTLALSHASSNNIADSTLVQVGAGATLNVTGLTGGTLALASGQSLGGLGTVVGNVDVLAGAALAPGMSAGTLNLTGDLSFAQGAYFDVDIESLDLADLVQMSGGLLAVDDATIRVNLDFSPEVGDSWTILQGEGDLTGQFNPTVNVLSGLEHLDGWKWFEVGYGNSVVLTVVPEPGTWLLLLCGLGCGLLVRRRK